MIRTGEDPDNPGHVLEVMPWPVYQAMTDAQLERDLRIPLGYSPDSGEHVRRSQRIGARHVRRAEGGDSRHLIVAQPEPVDATPALGVLTLLNRHRIDPFHILAFGALRPYGS